MGSLLLRKAQRILMYGTIQVGTSAAIRTQNVHFPRQRTENRLKIKISPRYERTLRHALVS